VNDLMKPEVQLTGHDGNVFFIISRVNAALRRSGQYDMAKEFTEKALSAKSYDEVLQLCFDYVEVK
jgi:hypothetical protein